MSELRVQAPGLLLLPVDRLSGDEVVAALALIAEAPSGKDWLPVLMDGGSDGVPARVRPVSLGWASSGPDLARWVDGAGDGTVLELRQVLARIARARHDLNNPLTSAMAETQLALMDVQDPVLRQGLETVEEQLRRLRDMIASLRVLRPPL